MHQFSFCISAIACGLLAVATSAHAGVETWVSGTGTNAGNCPITAPCKTFQYAHNHTNPKGSINVLSPGSFGPLTIAKSISIVAVGVAAVIRAGGSIGAAIKIQAGNNAIVSLRGLTIDLRGTANHGIDFVSGAALHVHDSIIRRSNEGIRFTPASGTSKLYVADSVIADTSSHGIWVGPIGSGSSQAVLDRVRVENASGVGIYFRTDVTTGSITAMVRDSIVAGPGGTGISAQGTAVLTVERSAAVNYNFGIIASNSATIRIGDSMVSGNATGLTTLGGAVIESYGTNKVDGNGTDGAPTSTIAMK